MKLEEPPKAEDNKEEATEEQVDQENDEEQDDDEIEDFDEDGKNSISDGHMTTSPFYDFSAYRALDAQLDRLNSALDALEEKNDRIHEMAKDLLRSNRENRQGSGDPEEAMDHEESNGGKN